MIILNTEAQRHRAVIFKLCVSVPLCLKYDDGCKTLLSMSNLHCEARSNLITCHR